LGNADSSSRSGIDTAPLTGISFAEPAAAQQNFQSLIVKLTPALMSSLAALLHECPDPDSALVLLDRLAGSSAQTLRVLERHPSLAHYALIVFGYSRFLGETLLQNTDLLPSLLRERNLDQSFSREEFNESLARFRSRAFDSDAAVVLARFKRREYVRIMLRDVLKLAPLAETTAEISGLADVLIENALRDAENQLQRKYGAPQHLDAQGRIVDTPFSVLALGKLGGNELNYSSDIDLMFLFGDGEEPADVQVTNREYFVRLAQQVTEILSRPTREGAVFRIDLRLRPQGNEGELAISLSRAEHYYATIAHDWERQALIKLRHSAGSIPLAREFIRRVQPHVYTEKVNFAAIKTALVAREKMHANRYSRRTLEPGSESIDVKIDSGGIRDIEFLVQCLQRVYGGEEPWLRSGGTLFSLQKLHDKRHIGGKEFHDLTGAYEFLRHLEHRLQLRQGQQTHRLPLTDPERRILQRCMVTQGGVERSGGLVETVQMRMSAVAEIYQRVIYQQQNRRQSEALDAEFQLRSTPEVTPTDQSNQQLLERLASDAPEIYETARLHERTPYSRKNFFRFLSSAFTSSERYGEVLRNPEAMQRAFALFENSEYLTDILVRHPEEIASLAEWEAAPSRAGTEYLLENFVGTSRTAADPIFAYVAASAAEYNEKLSLLRRHYRHRVFASGARDLYELRNVYESLPDTTAVAEDAIAAAYAIAGAPEGLAVMALGRLGSGEFDVLSDADVFFVCGEDQHRSALTKAAEQLVHVLAAYTRDGMVFPVDARLRPRGAEGELLVTPKQLALYFKHEAQPWEALMYTKMRLLAGPGELGQRAGQATTVLFDRMAEDSEFLSAVCEMREKLETADSGEPSFRTWPGAIYDIDFISGALLIKHRIPKKGGTLRDRLWRCVSFGLLEKSDAAELDHAAELFRTVEHIVRLAIGRAHKWLPATEHAQQVTQRLSAQILRREFSQGLEAELYQTSKRVRAIYGRVLGRS
jgi:[glutamine synthetase] adenylyltransferase / [glutamine synthetase]-adenylyl-L-tyrosine phosphorylase